MPFGSSFYSPVDSADAGAPSRTLWRYLNLARESYTMSSKSSSVSWELVAAAVGVVALSAAAYFYFFKGTASASGGKCSNPNCACGSSCSCGPSCSCGTAKK